MLADYSSDDESWIKVKLGFQLLKVTVGKSITKEITNKVYNSQAIWKNNMWDSNSLPLYISSTNPDSYHNQPGF